MILENKITVLKALIYAMYYYDIIKQHALFFFKLIM